MRHRLVLILCWVFLLTGCIGHVKQKALSLKPVPRQDWPRFTDDMEYDGLAHAIQQSLVYLSRRDPKQSFSFGVDTYSTAHVIRSLESFLTFIESRPTHAALNRFLQKHYRLYESVGAGKPGKVLFTGYFEPLLEGSLEKKKPFIYPLYARPDDLVTVDLGLFRSAWKGKILIGRHHGRTLVPYPDRKAIDGDKRLNGRAKPLVWLKDPIDAFFLQIQGSGKVYIQGREPLNLHYHISNGRPYRSIGRLLVEKRKIERSKMSMQRIRAYLKAHPDEVQEILNANPSYVFFKIEKDGPKGSLDVTLTPGRSMALDPRCFPPGALGFIMAQKPVIDAGGNILRWSPLHRFVLHQDTGGAIRGPGRADLFWGNGPYAEIAAGHMQHAGKLYFLVLKPGTRISSP